MKPEERGDTNHRYSSAGRGRVVRVSAADTGSSGCAQALAIKARPARQSRARDPSVLRDFTLGPLMAALDRVEFDGRDEETVVEELVRTRGVFDSRDAPAHSGLVAWSVEAFRNYRAAWRTHQVAVTARCTRPVRSAWKVVHHRDVPDHRGVVRYEQTCWGRRYESDDGSVREMWLLGFTTPKERPSVVYAAAANVAAFGGSVSPDQVRQPDRVRVVVFGAMSPIAHQLPEWTAEQIRRRARDEVAPRLVAVVDGTERRAGRDCAQCPQTPGCAALPTVDLLPNLPAAHGRRQMLSVTDLRLYQSCPARYHLLRQLRIRDVEAIESQAIAVGRAVDTALRNRHVNGCRTHRCESGQPLDEAVNALPEESRRSAARMLDHHSTLCPFPDVEAHDSEQRNIVSVYDDRLDVVFIAAPDLLYPRSGGWVWRETKTSKRRLRRDRPLMRQVPQLALAVLLLASGSLGRDVARSRVEFEQLRSDGCVLEELDPGRPTVVTEAREVIGEMVGPLLVDTAFAPTPGRDCASCEVRRWCGPGSQHVAKQAGVPLHDR